MLFKLDTGLSNISIAYVNIMLCVTFTLFLIWRYCVEISQLGNFLGNVENLQDLSNSKKVLLSPFQRAYIAKFDDVINEKDATLNDMKVQLQEETDDLLAWVHEVKAPLTSLNLLIAQVEDLTVQRKLEYEWLRLHLLVDQQLHQTRFTSISKDNYLTEIELQPIVYKEIRAMQTWCIGKNIGFKIADLHKSVMTDGKWLAFIIRQILSNAIKYSSMNSEIKISTGVDDRGATLLHIKDEGMGIRKEDLPRIFQKSYTGTAGRESAQSTGMGLYLADNVAQKLGIRINVQTIVDEGSVFTLRFPLENEYIHIAGR